MDAPQGSRRSWRLWTSVAVVCVLALALMGSYLFNLRRGAREIWWVNQEGALHQVRGKPKVSDGCARVSSEQIICGNFEIFSDEEKGRRERRLERLAPTN